MTEKTTQTTTDESVRPEVIIGLVTDGAHSLVVAQFPTQEDAEAAYRQLQEIERRRCSAS